MMSTSHTPDPASMSRSHRLHALLAAMPATVLSLTIVVTPMQVDARSSAVSGTAAMIIFEPASDTTHQTHAGPGTPPTTGPYSVPSPTTDPAHPAPQTTAPPAPAPQTPAPQQPSQPTSWDHVQPSPPPPTVDPRTYPDARPAPARKPRPRGLGMLVSGWTVLGATYLTCALIGAITIDIAETPSGQAYGRRMLIPVGGPWAALGVAGTATGAFFTGMAGAAQAAGLALGVTGIALVAKSRADARVSLHVAPLRGGSSVGMRMAF